MTDITATTVDAAATRKNGAAPRLRIVIAGGAGHLGRLLTRHFLAAKHSVIVLTRDHRAISDRPAKNCRRECISIWDGKSIGDWPIALENADVLINLAGRSVNCRYNAKHRDEILRSRVESTTVLGNVIQELSHPPRVWLNASTATIYRHAFDREMDEETGELGGNEPNAPSTWRFSIEVARAWEDAFFSYDTPKTRKVALRTAMVMSAEPGGPFEPVLRLVRMGLGGAWGSGRQYMSWIHELDFTRALEFLIEHDEISGPVNVAAPAPLTNEEFMTAVRNAWGARIGLPAQDWMLEVGAFLLRTETELLLKSRRVVPGVLREQGFSFYFPAWPQAARDLVDKWRRREFTVNDKGGGT